MALTGHERETNVTTSDGDGTVTIWTAQRRHIGRLRRHPAFTEIESGDFEGSEWAKFTIAASDWSPASGAKRKVTMTDERRAELANRLAAARNNTTKENH